MTDRERGIEDASFIRHQRTNRWNSRLILVGIALNLGASCSTLPAILASPVTGLQSAIEHKSDDRGGFWYWLHAEPFFFLAGPFVAAWKGIYTDTGAVVEGGYQGHYWDAFSPYEGLLD